ncbi:MAG: hypothetical protein RLY31_1169 [Bacteroidota bacterium]|jgi:hypothetical protein
MAFLAWHTVLNGQQVGAYDFRNGVKGIVFDSVKVIRYAPTDNGFRVFLQLRRTGTVQTKAGPVYSGGKDKIWLTALGVIDFSKDLRVSGEELTFLRPDKVIAKEYNLLDGEGRNVADHKVLATQDDCVKSQWDLLDKYPVLKTEEKGAGGKVAPRYYNNTIEYTMLGLKPKAVSLETHTLKEEQPDSEKSLGELLFGGNGRKYDKSDRSIDLEPYRGGDKKNYWFSLSDPACDPVGGNIYAHHGHMIFGEMGNKSAEYEQEVLVLDKDGKELNRTEIKFDLPYATDLHQVLVKESPEDNLYRVDGLVHIYKQSYGIGYKKLNPEPNKTLRKFYQWDADGKLLHQTDFEAPADNANIVRAFHNGSTVSLLGVSTYKPVQFHHLYFADGRLAATESLDATSALGKGIGFSPSEVASFKWNYHYAYDRTDGSKVFLYEPKKEVMTGQTKSVQTQGVLFFRTGADGKLTHAQHIKRSATADHGYKIYHKSYPTSDGNYVVVFRDPQQGGTQTVDVYGMSGSDLSLNPLVHLDNAAELATGQVGETGIMAFFHRDTKENNYRLQFLRR